jgi:hypothetical protein
VGYEIPVVKQEFGDTAWRVLYSGRLAPSTFCVTNIPPVIPSPSLVILRVCDFFEFARKGALKTKDLSASKWPKNQKSHRL